jgi:hypothetical protein
LCGIENENEGENMQAASMQHEREIKALAGWNCSKSEGGEVNEKLSQEILRKN